MKRSWGWIILVSFAALVVAAPRTRPLPIHVDYPAEGTLFPPDFAPPTFLFRDEAPAAGRWRIEVKFQSGSPAVRSECGCEHLRAGEIDPRASGDTNKPPELTPDQAAARTWVPDAETWETIKRNSAGRPASIAITGFGADGKALSAGRVTIETSKDPVGAPIFYRDVPLMPSELEKGVIKPLAQAAVPLIAWRLKNVGMPGNRLLMTGLHTCANCHSFSRDGKVLGMDLDGPRNDKGLYTLVPLAPHTTIRNEDVIAWSSFQGKLTESLRVGFMSQVSPDGSFVVTMIEGPTAPGLESKGPRQRAGRLHFYVSNFKDYRFLQVFYPTRGILAWYSRKTGMLKPLPGAADPQYVHTNAVWSPDGKYLVFARAAAREPYTEGHPMAAAANDPNETQIRYDLYRIPFNEGRGGEAEPIPGASHNGVSNSFPKVSPDGRWIVFVQARNGLLMRPDSRLFIVPAAGGEARPLGSNLALMNSWHSFSPNGRWLVFSSKSRSPYTQMYLTHIDEEGRDSPAILVEGTTAANRAVNIPEFVNIPPDGLESIDVPAVEFYKRYEVALSLTEKGQTAEAVEAWKHALELSPEDAKARMNLGVVLMHGGKLDEAISELEKSLAADAGSVETHMNLGIALAAKGMFADAIASYEKALRIDPGVPEVHSNLGATFVQTGRREDGITEYRKALELKPDYAEVHNNLAAALAGSGRLDEAILHFQKVAELKPGLAAAHGNLGRALATRGHIDEAISEFGKALEIEPRSPEYHNGLAVALVYKRRVEEAVKHFEKAIEAAPGFVDAHYNLGDALYYLQGKPGEALFHWRTVLRISPNHLPVLIETALVLASSGEDSVRNGPEALGLAERAVQLTGGREPAAFDALAAALAELGRFPEAATAAHRALEMATARNNAPMVETLKTRIAAYEAGRPLRGR